MNRKLLYRVLVIAAATVAAIVYLVPTLVRPLPSWWSAFLPTREIRLGLDLQGGMHLVLQVEVEKAVEFSVERMAEDLKREMQTQKTPFAAVAREGSRKISVRVPEGASIQGVTQLVKERFPTLERAADGGSANQVIFTVSNREVARLKEFAVEQSIETIRNRVDQLGLSEPSIQRGGVDSIIVQMPGETDPERAKSIIGKTAVLEFKLLAESKSVQSVLGNQDPCRLAEPERGRRVAQINDGVGGGLQVLCGREGDPLTGRSRPQAYLVEKKTLMTGDVISDARPRPDTNVPGNYLVEMDFNPYGGRVFEDITGRNVGRQLAVVLDNTVYSAPRIQERIGGGRAVITGTFDLREARDLSIVLRAGALPAPVTIAEERTVGPSLGRDSIREGTLSFAVGALLVVMLMLVYYRGAGLVADAALVLYVLYLLGCLAAFGATLTLPGIAGVVLTLGMAVDANVLINERIREELRLGKTPRAAVDAGYERALPAILDSHVTTFLSGLILFQFGSGPVRGFAVTLCIGIVTTLFSAVFCTRAYYEYRFQVQNARTISV
ncbi:MAG: preprotein translocase subunit SecD [Candidatus Binatota bacterium]|jgi:preprotein translocase subunit SecD|nr:preprotein translocase subunit SecD [Candidatus Binatota bacterium]